MSGKHLRLLAWLALLCAGGCWMAQLASARASTESTIATTASVGSMPTVIVMTVSDTINPVIASYICRGIDKAEKAQAQCVVIMIDTPGGGLDPTKDIVKRILASHVPIVVFVAPRGAHAASAGSIIVMASHVAAMSPGTNMGAAHPVTIGQKMDKTMTEKVVSDLSAYVRSLAQRRGRNVEWAQQAIKKSASLTASEALNKEVIDIVANDLADLLHKLNGRQVKLDTGTTVSLHTAGAVIERANLTWRDKALSAIANPNIAYILLMIGVYGIFFELMNPGAIYPGVIGAISLVLAFFAFQMLPTNYAGLILIFIGLALFIAEVKVVSYGMLTLGGLVCLVLGSLMLVSTPEAGIQISLKLILPVALVTAALFIFLATLAFRAHARKPFTGDKGLVGTIGTVQAPLTPGSQGKVFVEGEIWNAYADEPIEAGAKVKVILVEGLNLKVKRHTS